MTVPTVQCTYMVDGWMKDFLISPCSVYIRTLVYIWQVFDIKMDLTYFVSANSATFGDYSVCRLWVLKIILKICLVESPCLGVVQLQLSCPQSFYPNQVTKVKPTLSTPLNNFYKLLYKVCMYLLNLTLYTHFPKMKMNSKKRSRSNSTSQSPE